MDTKGGRQGAAFRRNFNNAERSAFKTGATVLWKDDRKWHKGCVVRAYTRDSTSAEYVTVMNTDKPTRNVDSGDTTRAYPGSVKKA
jgi:hypothetical protein